ncbi:MAG: DNA-directed RNA polymerase subunit omega [Lachnospiraceae bacterium]|jgi:DNA-directed RNA polymerase subunit omega|nr:DNA-directed RNA polymerase subunit omega [Lachnospiraceae bacterium]
MLHPSYTDLINAVNSEVAPGEEPIVQSRYSIVIATAKRARQLIAGDRALLDAPSNKPLSTAVEEINQTLVRVIGEDDIPEDEIEE